MEPSAFTTLALVFHELITNAAKYGALSGNGTVLVNWRLTEQGDLLIEWSERGGPPVSPPSRRGFGSKIIERSIPYDLKGSATSHYLPGGFEAQFKIPAQHLAGVSALEFIAPPTPMLTTGVQLLAGLNVLVVEDSMIIAVDCAEILKSLGAEKVIMASSVTEALAEIEDQEFQFALLDFDLGVETSSDVADVLAGLGIPFAFATGFGGDIQNRGHASAPVIEKPYGKKQLIEMLVGLGFEQEP